MHLKFATLQKIDLSEIQIRLVNVSVSAVFYNFSSSKIIRDRFPFLFPCAL